MRLSRTERRRVRNAIFVTGIFATSVVMVLVTIFCVARHHVEEEWGSKFPLSPRAPVEVRSLLDSLVDRPGNGPVPAFIPQSMWDNERCASAVIQAANFILGRQKLEVTVAWRFGQDNADDLRKVFDRTKDFSTSTEDKIKELVPFDSDLSKVLSSSRLYVAGYHFQQSRMDPQVLAAKAGINTHLVLAFEYQGEWWGYHFFHLNGKRFGTDPFRVEKLSDISLLGFDLVYIWELSGIQMDNEEKSSAASVFTHYRPTFGEASGWLGLAGNGRFGYYTDTVMSFIFGRGEQFPRIGDKNGVVVLVPPGIKAEQGAVVGLYRGAEIHQHPRGEGESERSGYGQRWQCVELVNRFYATVLGHRNMERTGHADSYFYSGNAKGLSVLLNGSPVKPAVNDILIFDRDGRESVAANSHRAPGHVAIVVEVKDDAVCVVQQNTSRWYECATLQEFVGGFWWVRGTIEDLPCVGWSRR